MKLIINENLENQPKFPNYPSMSGTSPSILSSYLDYMESALYTHYADISIPRYIKSFEEYLEHYIEECERFEQFAKEYRESLNKAAEKFNEIKFKFKDAKTESINLKEAEEDEMDTAYSVDNWKALREKYNKVSTFDSIDSQDLRDFLDELDRNKVGYDIYNHKKSNKVDVFYFER